MEAECWVLGGEFEDSVFEERPERRPGPPAPYAAKRCEPQWFDEERESSDEVEAVTVKKFKGDLAYRRQEYQEKKATNTDHLTTVLHLQFAVCSSLQNVEKMILYLQRLISLHPLDPWSWGRLAEAYLSLEPACSASFAPSQGQNGCTSNDKAIECSFPHPGKDCPLCFPETLPESSVFSMEASGSNNQKAEKAPKNTQNWMAGRREAVWRETQMKACASLIRTRLLLQLTQSQQTSFALEKNLRTQQEIEDKMKGFCFKEDTLLFFTEVMGEDIVPERIKDEVHSEVKCVGPAALAALVTASSREFEDKWFRKIKDRLCPLEDQFHTEIPILA
uniref:RIKEN cDNA 9130401M01 gene n=1 Tax=Jaculus jaculus TaxID=51337 RepID=A0A8C5P1P0_JACJA